MHGDSGTLRRRKPGPCCRRCRIRPVARRRSAAGARCDSGRGGQLHHRRQGERRPPRGQPALHPGRSGRRPAVAVRRGPGGPFDAILHLASPASPTDFRRYPMEIMRVNAVGTLHLLDRAIADGARFLMASTSEAYGDPLVHPQPETYWGNVNPIGVRAVYDESKRFAEAATMAYHRDRGAGRRDRAHLQHVRAADGDERRPGDPDVHPTGAARRTAHGASARARRPVPSVTSTTSSPASCSCSTRTRPARSTAAPSTRSACSTWPS